MNNKEIVTTPKDKYIYDGSRDIFRLLVARSKISTYEEIEKEEHKENLNMTIICQICNSFLSLFQCIQIKEFEYYIQCNICENYFRLEALLILVDNPKSIKNLQKEFEEK